MNTKPLGDRGEAAAADFLARKGLSILARQYRTPAGELDIVAKDGAALVFVEVKTRRTARFGRPALAVGASKQARIARAAVWYAQETLRSEALPPCRFDVVEVYAAQDGWRLRHLENAFEARGL